MPWPRILLAFFIITCLLPVAAGVAGEAAQHAPAPGLAPEPVVWRDGDTVRRVYLALDEAAVFHAQQPADSQSLARRLHPQARVARQGSRVSFVDLPEQTAPSIIADQALKRRSGATKDIVAPVYYASPQKFPNTRMALKNEIIVRFDGVDEATVAAIEARRKLQRVKKLSFGEAVYVYATADPMHTLSVSTDLYDEPGVTYSVPNWMQQASLHRTPKDPYFPAQWHLRNEYPDHAGEDIASGSMPTVWSYYSGSSNEIIAIVDDAIEITHEDLQANISQQFSFDWVDNDRDPSPATTSGNHGTAVASCAAGVWDNGVGVSGVAPNAVLAPMRLIERTISEGDLDSDILLLLADAAEALSYQNNYIDVYNNSWGITLNGYNSILGYLTGPVRDALRNGAVNGRNGYGCIYVWAAGNDNEIDDYADYEEFNNSRFTIAVAACDVTGKQADYSERGSSILINAPSGGGYTDTGVYAGITTADRTGEYGYNPGGTEQDYFDGNYTSLLAGTSFSAPLVSGAVALMLEAKPDLTWREVKAILLETAVQNDPADPSWKRNGGNYLISDKYGFGRIDVDKAIQAINNPELYMVNPIPLGTEISVSYTAQPNLVIPDFNESGSTSTIQVPESIQVEHVEVVFSANDHPYWADLDIRITSPSGLSLKLAETHAFENNQQTTDTYDNWRFGTPQFYGEDSQGAWTLFVKDLSPNFTGTFQSWTLNIYGVRKTSNPVSAIIPLLLLQ